MKLSTTVNAGRLERPFRLAGKTVLLGSCFADGIGAKMSSAGFEVCTNPFGTLYNPASIANAVRRLDGTGLYTAADCVPMGAGAEDIGLIGDVPLLVAKASGQKTVTFAKLSAGETTVALTLPAGSDISDPSQLKGKKVAYVKGSYGQHFLGLVLEGAGLTFDDIEQINLPNSDIGNAVSTEQADAGIIWEPGLSSTLSTGTIKILLDGTGIKSNNVFFFATQDFADNNPDALAAFIKAVERANDEIKADPAAAAAQLKDEINLPTETLTELLGKYEFSTYISDKDIDELKDVEKFNREQGFAANEVDVDAFVDRKHLSNAGITTK